MRLQALALAPGDTLAEDLLTKALSEAAASSLELGPSEEDIDLRIDGMLEANGLIGEWNSDEEDMDYD